MNQLELHVTGMSRSGNHAIVDWIFAQSDGPKALLNCAEGKTNPFLSKRPLEDGRGWRAAPEIDIAAEEAGHLSEKRLLVHTYEDSWLAHAFSRTFEDNHDVWVGPSTRRIDVLILRDPFNLFASRMRMGAGLTLHVARRMWKQHAREAFRPRYMRHDPLVILYNRWRAEPGYRRELARRLGLALTDEGIERVPACNGGSSFDGAAFDGRASRMAVTQRWRSYVGDERYEALFDAEMAELSAALFGPPPAPLRRLRLNEDGLVRGRSMASGPAL